MHVAVKHCWKASQDHMSARSAIYSASFRAIVIPIHMLQSLADELLCLLGSKVPVRSAAA